MSRYLNATGFEEFLPIYQVRRRWSDRVKVVDVPLFDGYVFCRFHDSRMLPVLSAPGVVHVVSFDGTPAPIPEMEIEALRQLVGSKLPASPCP
ncbi:MAG: transcription termination/antitermination NusG family protein, partial [Luteolibacter sp.]